MSRARFFVVALILSCQLSFTAAIESFSVAANEVHQVLSHQQTVDHHHRDAFATPSDQVNSDSTHQHATDSFQSPDLLMSIGLLSAATTASVQAAFHHQKPPSVFLDGLLRPPRLRV
jgi:hypothetical protein